jgi:hypothetical protein
MTREELAGYSVLVGFGLLLILVIKTFGLRTVLKVIFGIVLVAGIVAFGTLRAVASRR